MYIHRCAVWRGLFAGGWVGPMWRGGVGPATLARAQTSVFHSHARKLRYFTLPVQCACCELSDSACHSCEL